MRINMPVTATEHELKEGAAIVSKTTVKGVITYVNQEFLDISGFTEAELIGQAHNIVRHPDMPPEAYRDMWVTLKEGRPWTGIVKNRCKNGDFYWVQANVTPLRENGVVTGFMSVRTKPTRAQIDGASKVYALFRAGKAGGLAVHRGAVVKTGIAAIFRRISNMSIGARLTVMLTYMTATLVAGAAGGLSGYINNWTVAAIGTGLALLPMIVMGWSLHSGVTRRLGEARDHLRKMSEGKLDERIEIGAEDEIGAVLEAARSMQIKVGYDMEDMRRVSNEALRVTMALENSDANVMIANANGTIVYMNRTVQEMFRRNQAKLREKLPALDADKLVGSNIDLFHAKPEHQRRMIAALTGSHRTQIEVAGLTFGLVASPVLGTRGERLGTVVEWRDRTAEVQVEKEVSDLVNGAAAGDFSHRVPTTGKQGFFLRLSEDLNRLVKAADEGLAEASAVLSQISEGDLTARMNGTFEGRFRELEESINSTASQLSGIVKGIREGAETIKVATREIAKGNSDLSQRTEEQASSLEETAAAMEEIASTTRGSNDSARQANQLALGASEVAVRGGEVVRKVVETVGGISESSRKIADIIGVIDGIAFQTNILALNAAVEAARAGEQGRGFAVVATEVRNLAQRSASAAKEIKTLIEDSVGRVEQGQQLVDTAGKTIDEVVMAVKRVTDVLGEVTAASTEQTAGIDQINTAITQMDEVTQQNAALVEEAAAAAESLEEQAGALVQSVAVFKVAASEAPAAWDGKTERRGPDRARNVARIPTQTAKHAAVPGPKPEAEPKKAVNSDDWKAS